jgi:DNA primase
MASEIERIRREISLPETAAKFGVSLKRDGSEYVACCPFHAEDTASFTIFTGKDKVERFHCFGCGKAGDVLDFVQEIKGESLKEAIAILGGGKSAGPNVAPRKIEVRDIYDGITPLNPTREIKPRERVTLYNPKRAGTEREWGSFSPSLVHPYRRADGSLIGYVLRHDLPDGGKETPMVMAVRLPNGKECWSRFPFPKPRPLYGLEALGDARQVIIVEGEKCRDALAGASGRVVVSWPGGTQGVKHCDWSPLAGRNVVMWPDADKPGLSTADEIGGILVANGCTFRVLDVMGATK